jgi:hypothetical protein
MVEKKKHLDHEDVACVSTAKRIESIYNKICQISARTTQPFKEVELQPILIAKTEKVVYSLMHFQPQNATTTSYFALKVKRITGAFKQTINVRQQSVVRVGPQA